MNPVEVNGARKRSDRAFADSDEPVRQESITAGQRRTPPGARLRAVCLLCGLMAVLVLGVRQADVAVPPERLADQPSDALLHAQTIDRLRQGEDYYTAVGSELRRAGYPTGSLFNWRTPAHYRFVAFLGPEGAVLLMRTVAAAVILLAVWAFATRPGPRRVVAGFSMFGAMLVPLLLSNSIGFAEAWAGLAIGISLALYRRSQWLPGAGLGVIAVFLRELSVPYAVVCGVIALANRRTGESAVWAAGAVAYTAYYLTHAIFVLQEIGAADLQHADSWVQFQGLSFVLRTLHLNGWLVLLPSWVTPIACTLGLAALGAPGLRPHVKWTLLAYVAFFSIVGQPFNFYWGLVVTPVWAYAVIDSIDGLRQLVKTAAGFRRPSAVAEFSRLRPLRGA